MAEADEGESKTSKSIIKRALFILIGLIVLGAIAGGVYWYLYADNGATAEVAAEEIVDGPIQYYDLQPDFVVSFLTQTNQRFAQVGLAVVTKRQPVMDALKLHEPLVRNDILKIIGDYGFSRLRTIDGKLDLQKELTEHLNTVLSREANVDGVLDVIFTDFVTQ